MPRRSSPWTLRAGDSTFAAFYEAHEVAVAVVQRPVHPKLFNRDEAVGVGVLEVEDGCILSLFGSIWHLAFDGDTVAEECVLLLVGLKQRVCGKRCHEGIGSLLTFLDLELLVQLNRRID